MLFKGIDKSNDEDYDNDYNNYEIIVVTNDNE